MGNAMNHRKMPGWVSWPCSALINVSAEHPGKKDDMAIELLDTRALRRILTEVRITRRQFAATCGLNSVLTGVKRPGEEARHAAA